MAYSDKRSLQERGTGIVGVVVVHVGLAALVMVGLSTTVTKEIFSGPLPTRDYPDIPPPPPSDDPAPKPDKKAAETPAYTPPIPDPLPRPEFIETKLLPHVDEWPSELTIPPKQPIPGLGTAKPIAAAPRNDPGRWVTDSDYRSRWINEEMSGTARFTLDVDGNGRVSNCQITQSTGYAELDRATCTLIAKRAKFKPARDGNGNAATGSYSSSIRWQLPD